MKIKFTLIDYLIIILVICAIAFAFVHIATDDSSDLEKTAFDESTIGKIPDTYLKYYREGYVVKSTVEGFNSTNGEPVTINGTVVWEDDNSGNDLKLLIESGNETYLAGLYKNVPNADIYIDHVSIESDGEKYKDLCEVKIKPEEISSLKDLTDKIPDGTNYELSTTIALDSVNSKDMQKVTNKLLENDERISIKTSNSDMDNQILITKATKEDLTSIDAILDNIDAITDDITIRIYNCTDGQLNEITKNFEVKNVRNF
jgi:hypothetical protein